MGQQKCSNKLLKLLDLDRQGPEISFRPRVGTMSGGEEIMPADTNHDQDDWRVRAWADLPHEILLLDGPGILSKNPVTYQEDLGKALDLAQMLIELSLEDQEEARGRKRSEMDNEANTVKEASQTPADLQAIEQIEILLDVTAKRSRTDGSIKSTQEARCHDVDSKADDLQVAISHNVLLLVRQDVPSMAHVVYGSSANEASDLAERGRES